ncbi:hypothetical protein [Pontiella sp.]|uniref:hypothetical protein n=1 Tax=Pontiella sp. TaxID=2837462 RepID=UPI003566E1F3
MSLNDPTTLRLITDTAMLMLIWLVQLVIYPAFRSIDPARFIGWHGGYMRTFSFIVIPPMLLQAGLIAVQCMRAPTPAHWISAAAVLAAWLTTFTVSVPCHRQLQLAGNTPKWTNRLIRTNWIRTAAWSLAWLGNGFPLP